MSVAIITRLICSAMLTSSVMLTVALLGCSEPVRQDRGEVLGTVTLDGKPVPEGTIVFQPTYYASGFNAAVDIVNGKYHIPSRKGPSVGKNEVRFSGTRRTGAKVIVDDRMMDEYVDVFPPHYSSATAIPEICNIVPGRNVLDFQLSSTEPPAAQPAEPSEETNDHAKQEK